MRILGLHVHTGQTAAALTCDGVVQVAGAEERFDRIKQSRAFPKKAINFCLNQGGMESLDQLDGIAISWNPAENMRHINLSGFTSWRRYDPEWLYIVPNHLMGMAGKDAFPSKILKTELGMGNRCPIYYVDHHLSHMAHAIFQSPFSRGLAMVIDEYGEFDSVTVATFSGNKYEIIKKIHYPNSLGVFYAAITEFLGFTPNSDEWKVMGAGALGDSHKYYDALKSLLVWDEKDGEWVLDTRFIEHSNMKRSGYINERFVRLMGFPPRKPNQELTQNHYDVAASAQLVFEELLFSIINHYARMTKETALAISGGSLMNSLANGKILSHTPINKLFIPYAAADNGGAMGAALAVFHYGLAKERLSSTAFASPYLGPAFRDDEIKLTLERYKLTYTAVDNPAVIAATALTEGKLVGWFQGRMEFGERALGNRSILADPRDASMKDKINMAVKYRESFRPFAPSILRDHVEEYFEIPDGVSIPYMEQVYPIRIEKRSAIPAVVHADGTGRLQTVERADNPLYHELIEEFMKLTGIPVVLNTSFNVQGEPIVCSPSDAIRTFYTCGLDMLILGCFVICK